MQDGVSPQDRAGSTRLASAAHVYRIVAYADSLAMPRIVGEDRVLWEETWPYLLDAQLRERSHAVETINCGVRARTIDSLVGEFDQHVTFKHPDAIVVQVGITDCAPRIFSRTETRLLNSRFVPQRARRWVIEQRSRRRAEITTRRPLAKVYTQPAAFAGYLERFRAQLAEVHWPIDLVVLPILADASRCEAKSPGHTRNVDVFNAMLREFSERAGGAWLALPGLGAHDHEAFCSDGYHLNVEGNRRLALGLRDWFAARIAHRHPRAAGAR